MAYALQFQKTDVVSNFNGITTGTGAITLTSGNFSASGTQLYVIDYDTANAEVVSATVSGTTLTLVARGLDGTSAVTHTAGAKIGAFFVPSHYSILSNHMEDGWTELPYTLVYASADDPTFTFTVAGVDLSTVLTPGTRIKLTQTTAKYFIVTKVAFSTNTTVTVYGGTDYDLANAAITSPYYSRAKAPAGFPLDPTKWTVEVTDSTNRSQASPVSGTWYNLGTTNSQITIPIGLWNVEFNVSMQGAATTAVGLNIYAALSTTNNSATDAQLISIMGVDNVANLRTVQRRGKLLSLSSKTLYYLNGMMTTSGITSSIIFEPASTGITTVTRAICAYL